MRDFLFRKRRVSTIKNFGKKWTNNKVVLKANVSSQYISALLLTAAKSEKGLDFNLGR